MSGSAFLFLASLGANLLSFSLIVELKTFWFALVCEVLGFVLLYFFDVNKTALLLQFDFSVCLLFLAIIMEKRPIYGITGLLFAFMGNFIYNRKNSILFFGMAMVISASGIFIFAKYLAKDFGTALVKTTNLFVDIIVWILKQIWAFFVWISSLFPDVEVSEYEVEKEKYLSEIIAENQATPSVIASYIVACVIGLLLLYLLFMFIRYMIDVRKQRVKVYSLEENKNKKEKIKWFFGRVHYKKGTILWKYNRIKRKLRLSPSHKKKYETPKEFLLRTEEQGIIDAVNIALYSKDGKSNSIS